MQSKLLEAIAELGFRNADSQQFSGALGVDHRERYHSRALSELTEVTGPRLALELKLDARTFGLVCIEYNFSS